MQTSSINLRPIGKRSSALLYSFSTRFFMASKRKTMCLKSDKILFLGRQTRIKWQSCLSSRWLTIFFPFILLRYSRKKRWSKEYFLHSPITSKLFICIYERGEKNAKWMLFDISNTTGVWKRKMRQEIIPSEQ